MKVYLNACIQPKFISHIKKLKIFCFRSHFLFVPLSEHKNLCCTAIASLIIKKKFTLKKNCRFMICFCTSTFMSCACPGIRQLQMACNSCSLHSRKGSASNIALLNDCSITRKATVMRMAKALCATRDYSQNEYGMRSKASVIREFINQLEPLFAS